MPSTTHASGSTTSSFRLSNILDIVRAANARYERVADELRSSLRHTNHARARATALGLRVNMDDAHKCPQTAVSRVPLPVLTAELSPLSASIVMVHTQQKNTEKVLETLVIRIPSLATRMGMQSDEQEMTVPGAPVIPYLELLDTPMSIGSASSSGESSGPETPQSPCPLVKARIHAPVPTKRKCSATEIYAPKQQMKRRWIAETPSGRASPHLVRA